MKTLQDGCSTTDTLQTSGLSVSPAEPLWKRAPTHDEDGHKLSDFMMLIPRLSKRPRHQQLSTIDRLQHVLEDYRHVVVFADLNFRLNILWVSVRPKPGICLELPTAINARVPEAKLVGQNPQHFV